MHLVIIPSYDTFSVTFALHYMISITTIYKSQIVRGWMGECLSLFHTKTSEWIEIFPTPLFPNHCNSCKPDATVDHKKNAVTINLDEVPDNGLNCLVDSGNEINQNIVVEE